MLNRVWLDITYKGSTVSIKLALTIAEGPMRNQIETEIQRKLLLIENIDTVNIDVTAMNKKDSCLLYTSPSPRDGLLSRMPSSA